MGSALETPCKKPGIISTGKNDPERNIIGNPIALAIADADSASLDKLPSSMPTDVNRIAPAGMMAKVRGVRVTCRPRTSTPTMYVTRTEALNSTVYVRILDVSHSPFVRVVV